jgi:hypothetical protein
MAHEYVFRGEHKPFAPDPKDERAREAARLEAEELVNKPQPGLSPLPHDAELEEKIGEYQVGGLDAFGTEATADSNKHLSDGGVHNR